VRDDYVAWDVADNACIKRPATLCKIYNLKFIKQKYHRHLKIIDALVQSATLVNRKSCLSVKNLVKWLRKTENTPYM